MTQVYSFVDDNGVTRLFAEIQPDPAGTPFNGGAITSDLSITGDGSIGSALTVTGDANGDQTINATSGADAGDYAQAYKFADQTGEMVLFTTDGQYDFVMRQADTNGFRVRFSSSQNVIQANKTGATGGLGFYDHAPVAQPVVPLTAPTVQNVITALVALGLVAQHD